MKYIMLVLLAITTSSSAENTMGRVDPHGAAGVSIKKIQDFSEHKSCTICHDPKAPPVRLRADVDSKICLNCHNKTPHSGASEHVGKAWKNAEGKPEAISCQSCHSPHRADQVAWPKPSQFFKLNSEPGTGLTTSNKANPMLKRVCVDCHKW